MLAAAVASPGSIVLLVESPAKAKKLQQFLGDQYKVCQQDSSPLMLNMPAISHVAASPRPGQPYRESLPSYVAFKVSLEAASKVNMLSLGTEEHLRHCRCLQAMGMCAICQQSPALCSRTGTSTCSGRSYGQRGRGCRKLCRH